MSLELVLLWAFVGLVAGGLATSVAGEGYGVIGDIVIGIAGAFLGGLGFRSLSLASPFAGTAGMIFVALIGAIALLLLLRVFRRVAS